MTAKILSPLKIRGLEIQNRIMMSPMAQYSAQDGIPNEWHTVHYGSRAVGKVGLIMFESTAVEPKGRITPWDLGLWSDHQIDSFSKIANFITSQNSVPGIQLNHAGRKASTSKPWEGSKYLSNQEGGWETVGPSPIPFTKEDPPPHELSIEEINNIIEKFVESAQRAAEAGFKIVEIHSAHGYLLHEFLSPVSNKRSDEYGGSLENRQRLLLEISSKVRNIWPENMPVFVRISATDWVHHGWDIDETIETAKKLAELGIDLIDVSSGGNIADFKLPEAPNYQVPFSEAIKDEVKIYTGAVGLITAPYQANNIIENEKADIVAIGRELLRNPYWVFDASKELNVEMFWPKQYLRAKV